VKPRTEPEGGTAFKDVGCLSFEPPKHFRYKRILMSLKLLDDSITILQDYWFTKLFDDKNTIIPF